MVTANQAPQQQEQLEEPADYDSWYSALVSFVFHFCLVMLLQLLAQTFTPTEHLPPAIEVVQVVDTTDATGSLNDDLPASEGAEMSKNEADLSEFTEETPKESANRIEDAKSEVELSKPEDASKFAQEAVQRSKRAAAAARAAAASQLNENLGGGNGGSGGEGGGRAGRAARWILNFNTSNAADYVSQIGGLGGEVAFPTRGGRYMYVTDLSGAKTKQEKDLNNENRIYWFDQSDSVYEVARYLNVNSSGGMMVAFLPPQLEQRMVEMELAHQGATSEDQIAQTVFVCIVRGGGYDVRVLSQILR